MDIPDQGTIERAKVVALPQRVRSSDAVEKASNLPFTVQVETFQQSTCGSCAAKQSCGQGVLGRWFAARHNRFDVSCNAQLARTLAVGQWVDIEIAPDAVVKASFYAYLAPLVAMLFTAILAEALFANEAITIFVAVLGLFAAFAVLQWYMVRHGASSFYQPSVVNVVSAPLST